MAPRQPAPLPGGDTCALTSRLPGVGAQMSTKSGFIDLCDISKSEEWMKVWAVRGPSPPSFQSRDASCPG